MSTNWDDLRNSIEEFFSTAAEKTDELIRVGRRKLSIVEIRRDMTAKYAELGGRVYHLIRRGEAGAVASDREVESLVSKIQGLEGDLKAKEVEIQEIKTAGAEKSGKGSVSSAEASKEGGGGSTM